MKFGEFDVFIRRIIQINKHTSTNLAFWKSFAILFNIFLQQMFHLFDRPLLCAPLFIRRMWKVMGSTQTHAREDWIQVPFHKTEPHYICYFLFTTLKLLFICKSFRSAWKQKNTKTFPKECFTFRYFDIFKKRVLLKMSFDYNWPLLHHEL